MPISGLNISDINKQYQHVSGELAASNEGAESLREEFTAIMDEIAHELRARGVNSEQFIDLETPVVAPKVRPEPSSSKKTARQENPEVVVATPPSTESTLESEDSVEKMTEQSAAQPQDVAAPTPEQQAAAAQSAHESSQASAAHQKALTPASSESTEQDVASTDQAEQEPVEAEGESSQSSQSLTTSTQAKAAVDQPVKDVAESGAKTQAAAETAAETPAAETPATETSAQDDAALFLEMLRTHAQADQQLQQLAAQQAQQRVDTLALVQQLISPALQTSLLKQAIEVSSMTDKSAGAAGPKAAGAVTDSSSFGAPARQVAQTSDALRSGRVPPRAMLSRAFERVESVLKEVAQSKDGKSIQVTLDPGSLGKVRVGVTIKEGVLHARVIPESMYVADTVRERAHELLGALRKLGMDVDRIEISVANGADQPSEGSPDLSGHSGFSQQLPAQDQEFTPLQPTVISGSELKEGVVVDARELEDGHWVA